MSRLPKEQLKSSNGLIDIVDESLQEDYRLSADTGLIEPYLDRRVAILLYLAGYVMRDGLKGPAHDLCLTYQRSEEDSVRTTRPEIRYSKGCYSRPYDMKATMLVDDVEGIDVVQGQPHPSIFVIPSVVRLQELDSTAMTLTESAYLAPLARVFLASGLANRECGELLDPCGNVPLVMPDMELKHDVVECGSEIEQRVADNQSAPCRIESWPLVSVERVLVSFALTLHADGVSTKAAVPGVVRDDLPYFVSERLAVLPRPVQLLPRAPKVTSHVRSSS